MREGRRDGRRREGRKEGRKYLFGKEFRCNMMLFVMFSQCSVTLTMSCNNVSVICNHMIVTGYVLLGACNKYPVLLLLLLFTIR